MSSRTNGGSDRRGAPGSTPQPGCVVPLHRQRFHEGTLLQDQLREGARRHWPFPRLPRAINIVGFRPLLTISARALNHGKPRLTRELIPRRHLRHEQTLTPYTQPRRELHDGISGAYRRAAGPAAVGQAPGGTVPSCGGAVTASRHLSNIFVTPPPAPRILPERADLPSCLEPRAR